MSALARRAPYRAARMARVVWPGLARYRWLEWRDTRRGESDAEAWLRAHERLAHGLASLGLDLGGLFVKLCQVAGARADVLPAPFVRELGRFHDRVPPRPWPTLAPHVERELERPLETLFEHVDAEPLAAASLAQVHRARLRDGRAVVLKVQYPEAARLYATDLALVRRAVRLAGRLFPNVGLRGPVEEVAHFIGLELDFGREAESTERVRTAFAGDPAVRIPELHHALCTPRLLVMEHLDGIPIHDTARLVADGVDLPRLADRVADLYGRMIFEQGFFHGDPHPGNLLVLRDGRLGLLDFGLAKALPEGFGPGLGRMLGAAFRGEREATLDAARQLGFRLEPAHAESFGQLLQIALGARHDLATLRRTMARTELAEVPPDVALVFRTLVLLNGLSERLAPGERRIARMLMLRLAPHVTASAGPPVATAAPGPVQDTRLPAGVG